jgi:small-conductance mechanosensitive channel
VLKTLLAIFVFVAGYIFIQRIVGKIKKRIESNSLESDIYSRRTSGLIGKLVFVLLMIFLILAVFQVIGFDTAIIM